MLRNICGLSSHQHRHEHNSIVNYYFSKLFSGKSAKNVDCTGQKN